MKNLHILPTDKPSRLWLTKLGNLTRCHNIKPIKEALGNNVNIYITSDEKIKERDWFLFANKEVRKADRFSCNSLCKKIILTTDQDLIKDGVQEIPDEFLEWFVKNPSYESVEVVNDTLTVKEMSSLPLGTKNHKYKIIISKEEPKQETLEEFANKTYPFYGDVELREAIELGAKWQQKNLNKCYHPLTERKHTSDTHFECTICGYNNY